MTLPGRERMAATVVIVTVAAAVQDCGAGTSTHERDERAGGGGGRLDRGACMVKMGWRYVLAMFAAAAIGAALAGCGAGTSTSTSIGTSQHGAGAKPGASSDAVRLASYEENAQADAQDPLARSFQRSLNALKPLCRESSDRVAAESWATWNDLLKNQVRVSLLHVVHALQTIGKGVSGAALPTNCGMLLAAYDVELESGKAKP